MGGGHLHVREGFAGAGCLPGVETGGTEFVNRDIKAHAIAINPSNNPKLYFGADLGGFVSVAA